MANELLSYDENAKVFQTWTCAACGARIVMNVPDTFYNTGVHDEPYCLAHTRITHCGFELILGGPGE